LLRLFLKKEAYIEEALPEDNRYDCGVNFYGRRILVDPLCLPITSVDFIDKARKIFVRFEEGALSHSIAHHR